jgi:hypothetical protein
MTLNASGNLSIGNTNNTYKLDVTGQIRVNGSTNEQLIVDYTTASGGFTWQSFRINGANKYRFFGNTDNSFALYSDTAATQVLTIASTGAATFSSSVTAGGIASLGTAQTTVLAYIGDTNTVNTRYIKFARASALTDIVNIQGVNGGVGAANISLQAEGGNVGIGTTNPGGTLELLRANDSGVILRIGNTGSTYFDFSRSSSTGALSIQGNQTGNNNILLAPTSGNVGIGNTAPNSNLHVTGSVAKSHVTKSANYTLNGGDYTVGFDCTGGDRTATLPDATTCTGRIYVIYQYNTGGALRGVLIDGNGSQTINGETLYYLKNYCEYTSAMIQSNGSNWIIIANAIQSSCL